MFLAGIITGILISLGLVFLLAPKLMFSVSESKYDFATTKALIEKATPENKWSMPHQYDLQATMKKHGFDVKAVTVYSICKPDIAVKILGADDNRHISAMMPCRIAIYEKADGKTYIARMNAGLLAKLLGNEVNAVMGDAETGSEKILEQVIKK
ncbi:uncharacterized protein (DUF302 family) [Mangrovibacterium diazotrophicum]|uniref:Uncharacterized protein (DUF302 family) n=2 Tax=Mangrovibacterium diazotrophicum TaxID=1261403 RepID=A0A419W7H5_9BACT|nr:uncharacterized protein (DUF302 family) [Mangrovibacterium diazotrophicum]